MSKVQAYQVYLKVPPSGVPVVSTWAETLGEAMGEGGRLAGRYERDNDSPCMVEIVRRKGLSHGLPVRWKATCNSRSEALAWEVSETFDSYGGTDELFPAMNEPKPATAKAVPPTDEEARRAVARAMGHEEPRVTRTLTEQEELKQGLTERGLDTPIGDHGSDLAGVFTNSLAGAFGEEDEDDRDQT